MCAEMTTAIKLTKTDIFFRNSLLLGLLVLTACRVAPVEPPPPQPEPEPRNWVVEIRDAAAALGSYVEVSPWNDPGVADLRELAIAAERASQWAEAERLLGVAVDIAPTDPELWQFRAEIALAERRWLDARSHAQQSEALGPKLGELCLRNWMTLAAVAEEVGEPQAKNLAEQSATQCAVQAPVRL